ncbi:MAG: glycosyltransferase [Fischerella sp.]|jgi:glycosyltransferase involved in cell wall biosynthesis|uniref:glycosyltransferase n=1 Tax=Fischerella sp. TaxID=1191 RepID=UPI00179C8D72|nr:glycosyltransferase [Fischerella sp.]NWF61051.1 glycosyltransferase [Fischerella sp.]
MKILFYFGGFVPVGGIETFCKNLLCYLQARNYDCRLVCWGPESALLQRIEDAKVKIVRIFWQWGCRWNIPDWLLLPISLQQVKQADVILFGKLFPNKILKQLRLQAGNHTKFVYITPYRPVPPTTNQEKKYLLEALNHFDVILVQASSFEEDLRQVGYQGKIEAISYIPHQPRKLKPLPAQEQLKIGFLGRLVEDKNIPLLLEAFCRFQDEYLQASTSEGRQKRKPSLHLFGDGHLRKQLEQLVEKLGIASSVIFHGSIPNAEVEEVIASCHLFAFASRSEGQCLAALEILGCGRPIVATDAGALPDILSDSRLGRIVQSANPNEFADSLMDITKLIEQQSISPEVIRSAYLERYAPEKVGGNYEEILNSLCQRNF